MFAHRQQIEDALTELAERVAGAGASATIRVVGGAGIMLVCDRDQATSDIDALYGSSDAVGAAVRDLAAEHNWRPDWLNDAVKMYASDHVSVESWRTVVDLGTVRVLVAPTDLLLAMKLKSVGGRGARDGPDVELLCSACGIGSVTDAEAVFDRYYPRDVLSERALVQLRTLYPET